MTNLEINGLCAAAMEIPHKISRYRGEDFIEILNERLPGNGGEYNPLRDREQAMDLVLRFKLHIDWLVDGQCSVDAGWIKPGDESEDDDPLRAICLCVARMGK